MARDDELAFAFLRLNQREVQLECLRAGACGTSDLWGRVVTYKGRKR